MLQQIKQINTMIKYIFSVVFILANLCQVFSQDLGISKTVFYRKIAGNWEPQSQNEYFADKGLEKQIRYERSGDEWQKTEEMTRTMSLNNDTVRSTKITWENGMLVKEAKKTCYNRRDPQHNVVDLIRNGISKMEEYRYTAQSPSLDINEEGFLINYPYDELFRQADTLREQGISLANRKLEINWCEYIEFSINADKYNRIITLESERTKIEVTYREHPEPESGTEAGFAIYPNPCLDEVAIDLNGLNGGTLEILDSYGKSIFMENVRGNRTVRTNMTGFPSGIYLVNLHSGNKIYSGKLIKI